MFGKKEDSQRWVDERFLQVACDAMLSELDWDSLDSGRLHRATSLGKTLAGNVIIVGVLDSPGRTSELLHDAEQERRGHGLPPETPLWLYVPTGFREQASLPPNVLLKSLS